jgi:hypothetical protein
MITTIRIVRADVNGQEEIWVILVVVLTMGDFYIPET